MQLRRLTGLSNVVAYAPVILSEAKDLITAHHGHEILRYAQDDSSAVSPICDARKPQEPQ
jgi:hypothetical protein